MFIPEEHSGVNPHAECRWLMCANVDLTVELSISEVEFFYVRPDRY